jgi:hypothetical protein
MSSFPSIERRIVQTSFPIAGITRIVTEIGRNNNGEMVFFGVVARWLARVLRPL